MSYNLSLIQTWSHPVPHFQIGINEWRLTGHYNYNDNCLFKIATQGVSCDISMYFLKNWYVLIYINWVAIMCQILSYVPEIKR
jgi:hypothetical protein